MPQNSTLTPDQIDQLLEHAQAALQSSIEKGNQRYGSPEEGDIDYKKLSQDALVRLDEFKGWDTADYAAAKDAVIQKFGVEQPMQQLAEKGEALKAAQKKLEGMEKLAQSDVLGTSEAVADNERAMAAVKKDIEAIKEEMSDLQVQVSEGKAHMSAVAERNQQDKKAVVKAANEELAGELQNEAPSEDQEVKQSVRFGFQAARPKSQAASDVKIGARGQGQEEGGSVREAMKWTSAKPDTSQEPQGPKLR